MDLERARSLGDLGDSLHHDLVGGVAVDELAVEAHSPPWYRQQARNRGEQGRLARSVGAQNGHDLPPIEGQAYALESFDRAVEDVQILDFKKGHLS